MDKLPVWFWSMTLCRWPESERQIVVLIGGDHNIQHHFIGNQDCKMRPWIATLTWSAFCLHAAQAQATNCRSNLRYCRYHRLSANCHSPQTSKPLCCIRWSLRFTLYRIHLCKSCRPCSSIVSRRLHPVWRHGRSGQPVQRLAVILLPFISSVS